MHSRLSLQELLLSGVPCSSSSFPSSCRSSASGEIGPTETKIVYGSTSIVQCSRVSASAEGGVDVPVNCRKREGKAALITDEAKRRKVFKDSWFLVGRLLLWNRTASSHPTNGSNSMDCLAFCDGVAAVCCTVQTLELDLLGQYVQVNSWTFVPATRQPVETSNAEDGSAVSRLKRTKCHENAKVQEFCGNVQVLPQTSDCGGCLEIHSMKLLGESSAPTAQVSDFPSLCLSPAAARTRNLVLESPLEKTAPSKPRLRVQGFLHCISPPFILPSKSSLQNAPLITDGRTSIGQGPPRSLFKDKSESRLHTHGQCMPGFLVELCTHCLGSMCQPTYNNFPQATCSHLLDREVVDAREDGSVAIYFSGAVASWRAVLGGMLGDCVAISGLRRKTIRLGPDNKEFCIHVATRTSLVFCIGSNRGVQGEFRLCNHINSGLQSYVGKITSIPMQDQLLELDNRVWLLLTHYKHTQIHGLQVGALVAVRHAHRMILSSVSDKVLVLGACSRSHIWVILHSISNARTRIPQPLQSRLTKYIGSLPFVSAFWALQVIISLTCKLHGLYSDKELLGSKKHAGLIRKVLPSMMAAPATLHRDAFKEFLLHEQFCSLGDTSASALLSKVPPLSNFCEHVETLWVDTILSSWQEDGFSNNSDAKPSGQTARICKPMVTLIPCYIRNVLSSSKLGVVLVGSLKVCQSSGKLQLIDATGALDAVVPDLGSLTNLHCFYQIAEYTLIMEGDYKPSDLSPEEKDSNLFSPLSWSRLLKGSVFRKRIPQSISYYVQFHLHYANRLQGLAWPSEVQNHVTQAGVDLPSRSHVRKDVYKGKEFNIALITHKCPARLKFSADQVNQWAFDAEAVLLPYNLLIHQDNDACSDIPNSPLQTFDLNLSGAHGATEISNHADALQLHKLKELGDNTTCAHGSFLPVSGCLIDCYVCCLVEQHPGPKNYGSQSFCTLPASLVARICSARTSLSGSYCATKEEHWARLSEAKLQKVVLAINWKSLEISQVLNTGDWCLLSTSHGNLPPVNSSQLNKAFKRVEIDASNSLIGLNWRYTTDCQIADMKNLPQNGSFSKRMTSTFTPHNASDSKYIGSTGNATENEGSTLKVDMGRCSGCDIEPMDEDSRGCQSQLVDMVLTMSNTLGDEFRHWSTSLESKLIPQNLSVSEALQLAPYVGEVCDTPNVGSSGIHSLQGEMVSIRGELVAVKCSNCPTTTVDGEHEEPIFSRLSGRSRRQKILCYLKDLRTEQLIGVQINFNRSARPVGFGPGAVVCFQRILLRRDRKLLVGMPTTNVVIESVERRRHQLSQRRQWLRSESLLRQEQDDYAENAGDVDFLNDFIREMEPKKKHLRVHCNGVTVFRM
ncbi:uncharacterized protein [Physcomitrium patens]|uniref:CST complex subunit CTC1 n=1 Tax=Physcomitrium patens TaxID=3218 RepID=A0A2K1JPB7_PHYPA|nr:uncharacterized protein LOC112289841 isoform X3 [Physcomitrium patens]PNR43382.1 hypothetical protein PHYPA_015762 [Physcomitrium patens]|eukprot:XP_024391259.1 uncharacterized protein LOC112289841 isoform X3 [Physcomitrella patens]